MMTVESQTAVGEQALEAQFQNRQVDKMLLVCHVSSTYDIGVVPLETPKSRIFSIGREVVIAKETCMVGHRVIK